MYLLIYMMSQYGIYIRYTMQHANSDNHYNKYDGFHFNLLIG